MTGPQHYASAVALLSNLRREPAGLPGMQIHGPEQQGRMIAEAQAHATLALAAATIDAATQNVNHSTPDGYSASQTDVANGIEWARVIA